MKWAHLPLSGGLYDQHPQLIAEWDVIFGLVNEKQAEEDRKREAEAKHSRPKSRR